MFSGRPVYVLGSLQLAIVSPPQIEQRTYTMDCTELATEKTRFPRIEW